MTIGLNSIGDMALQRLAWSSAPILVGPWRSELGFEVLYWLPWLAAFRERYHIAKERLIVVSRGGAGGWYDAGRSVELYDYTPLATLRKAMLADSTRTGSTKQYRMSGWEKKLLAVIAEDLGLRRYHVLHPLRMYHRLAPWWQGRMGHADLLKHVRFALDPLPTPAPPLTFALPERFVAVRFYQRHTWAMTDDLRAWVIALIEQLAKRIPVVLLDPGLYTDDHVDFPIHGDYVLRLQDHVTPQNNLAVQSAVIAKAQAFVGTYGGTMQLAIRLKKPSVGFYHTFEGTAYAHKTLVEWLAIQQKTPCFIGRPDDARLIKEIL